MEANIYESISLTDILIHIHIDSDIYTRLNILEFPVLDNCVVLLSPNVCFHLVFPSSWDLSSQDSVLIMNPQILLKSVEFMMPVVEFIGLRTRNKTQIKKLFPHSQLLDLRYIGWPHTILFPLISSENIHVHSAIMGFDWGNIWTYALHAVDKEPSLVFLTLYEYRRRKNGHIQQ